MTNQTEIARRVAARYLTGTTSDSDRIVRLLENSNGVLGIRNIKESLGLSESAFNKAVKDLGSKIKVLPHSHALSLR